jgi:hypothetical protein
MDPIVQKPKLLRTALYLNIVLDVLISVGLLVAYIRLFAGSHNAVDGGFAVILGIPFYIVPAALVLFDSYLLRKWLDNANRKLFTYYAITRSIVLLGAIYYFYQYVNHASTVGSGYSSIYFPAIVALALLCGWSGLVIHKAVKGVWQFVLLLTVTLVAVFGTAYMHASVAGSESGTSSGLAGSRRDNQAARDFQLLSQDVENYALDHGRFPSSLNQASSSPNSLAAKEGAASRLTRYDYKYNDMTGEYELCATFATAARDSRDSGFIKAYNHRKGYQCFSFIIDNWAGSPVNQTPSDNPATNNQPGQQNQGAQIYNY